MVKKHLPNVLTSIRFPLCVLGLILAFLNIPILGVLCLIACFVTDWADGKLARRWEVVSEWGKKWDPVIDLTTIVLIYFYMIFFESLPGVLKIMFLLVAFRNVLLSQGFKYLYRTAKESKDFIIKERVETINHVSRAGKWSTALQMIALTGFFFFNVTMQEVQIAFFVLIFIPAFCFSVYSGYKYTRDGWDLATTFWQRELFPVQERLHPFVGKLGWFLNQVRRLSRALPL